MPEEMIVFTRCYDLLAWLLPRAEKFPRAFRFTVTQRLIDAALDLQEALFEAQSQRGAPRLDALRRADAALNHLRLYLRLPVPAPGLGLALAQRRPVRARQRHRRRDRPPARRLAEAEHALTQGEAPRGLRPGGASLLYVPDGTRPVGQSVRTGPACAIHSAFASARQPWSAGISGPALAGPGFQKACTMWETHTNRKPRLLSRLPGSLWLR